MSRRPRKAHLTNIIDFATAVKRREESVGATVQREEAISFLPFSLQEGDVALDSSEGLPVVSVVIDRSEGVGIEMNVKTAKALLKALRAAVRSAKKRDAG